jgi:hypothetical protein
VDDVTPGSAIAAGLWRRLRDVILVAERIEDYTFGSEDASEKHAALREGEAAAVARDLTLRAFRAATEAMNWQILSSAAESDDGVPIDTLCERCGLPRLAVTERMNELIQAGLCIRAIDVDRILVTDAGVALVALLGSISADLASRAERAPGRERTNGDHGLPLL